MKVWGFWPKIISPKPAWYCICYLTVWEYWLGIAKPKNIFRSTLNRYIKLLWNFKNFLFNRFFCWLTDWLMPSDKRNSIMAIATGLIFSLFNVASSRDVPFRQPQQLQCSHHGFTKIYLCSPFLSPLARRWRFAVHALWLWCETRVIAEPVGVLQTLFFACNAVQYN